MCEDITSAPSGELPVGDELNALLHEHLFGKRLDAFDDDSVGRAVFEGFWASEPISRDVTRLTFRWNGKDYDVLCDGSRWNYGGAHDNDGYGLWCWHNRDSHEWKDDIEAHVKAWKSKARNYLDGNGMLLVVGKMRELGWRRAVTEYSDGLYIAFAKEHIDIADWLIEQATDEPTATGQAALRALKVI